MKSPFTRPWFFMLGLALGSLGMSLALATTLEPVTPGVPACQEDEVIVGVGNFDGDFWDEYRCAHPDRFRPKGEAAHNRSVRAVCSKPTHWKRYHGVTVMPEGCENAYR